MTSDPPKRRHADLMAIKVGWVLVSSIIGDYSGTGVTAEYPATLKQCLKNGGYAATELSGLVLR